MSQTIEVTFPVDEARQEFLLAELFSYGFHGFEQQEERLKAYVDGEMWSDELHERVIYWLRSHNYPVALSVSLVAERNWNQEWEQSIEPIVAGEFVVAPSWIDRDDVPPDHMCIEIDPRMSFGTGHHASTRIALRLLSSQVQPGERLVDAGAGTGILAIAAAKLGARHVFAFDNNTWACENGRENLRRNRVGSQVTYREGSLEVVSDELVDGILANINLHVLREWLPRFTRLVTEGGYVILSGILAEDRESIRTVLADTPFSEIREVTEEEWWGVTVEKVGS